MRGRPFLALASLAFAFAVVMAALAVRPYVEVVRNQTAAPALQVHPTIILLDKIVGANVDEPDGLAVLNQGFRWVGAADLGAIARYRDHWYLALGDAQYELPQLFFTSVNFLVATARYEPGRISGITLDDYLAEQTIPGNLRVPRRALLPDPGPTIPGSLFTVNWHGRDYLFAQYMVGGDFGGNDHWSRASQIARYDDRSRVFTPYKPAIYSWRRRDRAATNANRLQYSFGQSAFWEDQAEGYLYMVGAPTNRFGGVKLARLPIAAFLDPRDQRPWSYYMGGGRWSTPTTDEQGIDRAVPWLIAPRDPAFSLDKDYDTAPYPPGKDACSYLTIGEFSLVWDPYLRSFLLLTASSGCRPNVLRIYSAPSITGPWTQRPQSIPMPYTARDPTWDYYAPYTAPSLLRNDGRTMYFLASTYSHYGIYLYRADFGAR